MTDAEIDRLETRRHDLVKIHAAYAAAATAMLASRRSILRTP